MFRLPSWGRWAMVAGGIGIVAMTALIVICLVSPGCWLNSVFLKDDDDEKKKNKKKHRKERRDGSFFATQTLSSEANFNFSNKDSTNELSRSQSTLSESTLSTSSVGVPTKIGGKSSSCATVETSSLLSSLVDSNYSSMSEYSGRSSPSVSYQGNPLGSTKSGPDSPLTNEPIGVLSFGIQYIANTHDVNFGKLVITVLEASGLSSREYVGITCDAYVKVMVLKEHRSLRKQKSPPVIAVFRTRTIRHSRSPSFNQSFIMDAEKCQIKDFVLKLTIMDQDKWASPSTIGEVTQPLRDIKNLITIEHRTTLNYSLSQPKLDLGGMLIGLSYLPTAQRLSVSIIKANNLQYQHLVEDISDFYPFVRVLLISNSGRLLKKKKTSWRSGTALPVWNETLVFDITQTQMEHMTFLVVVCTRSQLPLTPTSSDVSYQSMETLPDLHVGSDEPLQGSQHRNDKYLGKVVLGCNVRDDESRNHWMAILTNPRKVASQWHPLT